MGAPEVIAVPEKRTVERAKAELQEGKRPTTAAGEFVREEMEHAKRGKHPVRSRKQAIAIGLSKARRSGIPLPPQKPRAGARKRPAAQAASRAGRRRPASRRGRSPRGRSRR